MADNVAITAGAGTTVAADEVTDGTLGSCKVQFVKLMDGTLDGTTKAAVGSNGLAVNHAAGVGAKGLTATFATLTRPANTTPYTALDSISDNATAGSVTALVSGNFSDANDAPVWLTHLEIKSTDTGLNGKTIRAYVFNSNPTSSSGVGAGDNAAYSNKQAGLFAQFIGTMATGISDGASGNLTPESGVPGLVALPASGARTFWVQYQSVDGFTPSANSTTIIGKLCGLQLKAS
jgi:hypothetical protein